MVRSKIESRNNARPHEPRAEDSSGTTEAGSPPASPGQESRGDRRMQKPAFPIHSYPWYVNDWRKSMMRLRLTPLGRYLYRELLDQCYIDGSIPDEPELLAKIADISPKDFQKLWPSVKQAFELREDGNWHHNKADEVLSEITRWREQKSNAGRKSGESRRTSVQQDTSERSTTVQQPLNERSTAAEPSVAVPVTVAVEVSTPVAVTTGDGWDVYIRVFEIAGKPLNDRDRQKGIQQWLSLDITQRELALKDICETAKQRDGKMLPSPLNHLLDKPWTRTTNGRLIPEPRKQSKAETAQQRAAEAFMTEEDPFAAYD